MSLKRGSNALFSPEGAGGSGKRQATNGETCVIGIDFGTSRTGYGYAFPSQNMENFDQIICKEPGGQDAKKTATSVLLDSAGNLKSFGFKARNDYYEEYDGDGEPSRDLLFEKFKMQLHESSQRSPQATAQNKKKKPLMDVIVHTLRYVKDEALKHINSLQPVEIRSSDCKWVLTVPAIWTDSAKGFMRKAAFKAGLVSEENSNRLLLALEPEAACLACESQSTHLKSGDEFMVLDCGGGTVDITLHSVKTAKPLALDEIAVPSGGPWGGTCVDREFEKFIEEIIGQDAMRKLNPSVHWVELMGLWEEAKLNFDPDGAREKRISVASILEVLDDVDFKQLIEAYNVKAAPNE
jgi:molecular chaperone DnaK (HSP70)